MRNSGCYSCTVRPTTQLVDLVLVFGVCSSQAQGPSVPSGSLRSLVGWLVPTWRLRQPNKLVCKRRRRWSCARTPDCCADCATVCSGT